MQTGTDSGDSSLQLCTIRIAFITTYLAVGEVEGGVASDIMVTGKPWSNWSMNTARVVDKYFAFLFAKKSEGSFHLDFRLICVIIIVCCGHWPLEGAFLVEYVDQFQRIEFADKIVRYCNCDSCAMCDRKM